jgi:Flp pilus assembly pilin Flp
MKPNRVKNRFLRGTSIIEYSLIIAAVAVALIGMSIYLKRAVSGKWKQSVDVFGYGRQYEKDKTIVP